MKKLKSILYILIVSLAFQGCSDEITEPVTGSVTDTKQVEIGFNDANNNIELIENGGETTLTVFISKTLPYDLAVSLEITSSDNSLETISGEAEVIFEKDLLIPAGSTSVDAKISFVDDGKFDATEAYTVSIQNAVTSAPLRNYFITNASDTNQTSRTILVNDERVITTTVGDLDIDLNWFDSSKDMDLYLFLPPSSVIDQSIDVNTVIETVTLNQSSADEKYYLFVDQWGFVGDVDFTLEFRFPDGQTLSTHIATIPRPNFVASVEKTTNGSEVTYKIIIL